jgi:hypothetical protein
MFLTGDSWLFSRVKLLVQLAGYGPEGNGESKPRSRTVTSQPERRHEPDCAGIVEQGQPDHPHFGQRLPRTGRMGVPAARLQKFTLSHTNLLEACASTNFRAKARFVFASASSSANKPASLLGFTVARPAQPAGVTGIAAKARPIPSSDPFGAERFERSRAKTPQGYTRAFNSISRELVGLPLTRKQQDEIRAQRPRLRPEEVDKNSYREMSCRGVRRVKPKMISCNRSRR